MRVAGLLALTLLAAAGCATLPDNAAAPEAPAVLRAGAGIGAGDFAAFLDRPSLLPDYERVVLDNGVVLLLLEKPEVPIVGFEAVLRGGAAADPRGGAGTASLLAELLRKGAGDRDAAAFAEAVEGVGGDLDSGAGVESLSVSASFLSRDAGLAVELLADLLMRPRLDVDEFEKLRARAIQFIKAAKDGSPSQLLPLYAATFLYGDHPYGQPSTGDELSLARLTIDDVRRYYREHVGADRLVVTVAGDFDAGRMKTLLSEAFGSWRAAAAPVPRYGSPGRAAGVRVLLIDKPDATQTYFWLGNVGVSKYYPQRAELALANTVFGGRFTSMLNTALRVESGLSYGASSRLTQPREAGSVGIVSFTATETTGEALELALATLDTLHETGLVVDSLDSVKTYLLGQFPLAFETAGQLARQAAQLEFYGLERDWVNTYPQLIVDADESAIAQVIADVYPRREELVFVLIGNAEAIRDTVAGYGELVEMSINEPRFAIEQK